MPEYSLLRKSIPAFGGGLAGKSLNASMNPFRRKGEKPAVFWSGIVDVDKNGTIINIPVPATFNGQLRIIAVGCSTEAMAAVEENVLVQAEVVIQPSLPLFLAPGDIFDTTLALTDMLVQKNGAAKNGDGRKVKLAVTMSPALELVSKLPTEIELFYAKQKTIVLRFRVKTEADFAKISGEGKNSENSVPAVLGEQTITFMAHAKTGPGGATSTVSLPVFLSVRPAQAKQIRMKMGRLFPAKKVASKPSDKFLEAIIPLDRNMYPQFAEISASVSPLPLPFIQALVQMLREYPYRCTEQYVSKTLPLLTLMRNTHLAPEGEKYTKEAIKEDIGQTLRALALRYKQDNSFAMWPNGRGESPLLYTVYSADFIVEAMDLGIAVPSVLRNDFLRGLEENLSSTPYSLENARAYAYGAWVLTRHGVITSNILANIVAWLNRNTTGWEKDIVAPLLAASMKLMRQDKAAQQLLSGYSPDAVSAWVWSSSLDGLAERSLYLTIVAKHFPEMLSESKPQMILEDIISLTAAQRYVTLSAAQAARALMLYSLSLNQKGRLGEINLHFIDTENKDIVLQDGMPDIAEGAKPTVPSKTENMPDLMIATDDGQAISRIAAVKYRSTMPMFYSLTSSGYDMGTPEKSISEGIEITREYRDLKGNILTKLEAGNDIVVAISARSLQGALPNIIISDLLPGACEFVVATGGAVTDVGTQEGIRLRKTMYRIRGPKGDIINSSSLQSEYDMDIVYADRREDRITIFANIDTEESVFLYRVRVANRGDFIIPPISAEDMYNPSVYAVSNTILGTKIGRMVVK